MSEQKILTLFAGYEAGTLSEPEMELFLNWFSHCSLEEFNRSFGDCLPGKKDVLYQALTDLKKRELEAVLDEAEKIDIIQSEPLLERNFHSESASHSTIKTIVRSPFLRKWGWAAASLLFLLASAIFILQYKDDQHTISTKAHLPSRPEILPGHDGAVLTLADGRQVVLDSLGNGEIVKQNGVRVVLENGQLAYNPTGKGAGEVAFNTMSTSNGRQFQLALPDGTNVWLNSASSIRYPTVFTGKDRRVEITGEVYFEVAKNASMPFRVLVNKRMEVEVLGTHFNVNAYDDESTIQTTLLEGSVKIIKDNNTEMILPGMQAQVNNVIAGNSAIHVVKDADLDAVMAWKNGYFSFRNTDLATVMRQISRWYDVEIEYSGEIPNRKFGGGISRSANLSQVLKIFEEIKVYFKVEKNKIIVLP